MMTTNKILRLKKPGLYRVYPQLYLRVKVNRRGEVSRYWIQRYQFRNRRRSFGIGTWPVVRVDEALEKVLENRRLIHQGIDPVDARRVNAPKPTFAEAAEKTIAVKRSGWKSPKTETQWRAQFERHIFPVLGNRLVDTITTPDLIAVIAPLATKSPDTGRKVRRRVRDVFAWCMSQLYVTVNPAGEAMDAAMPKAPTVQKHHRALPFAEVPAALDTIKASGAPSAGRLCLQLLILSSTRTSEALLARWDEIDLEAKTWTIPAERMKAKREHRVPLSDAAVAVLEQARDLGDGSGLVFPSPIKKGSPLSNMTLTKVMRDTGLAERATVHGFRSSFRDWCAESGKRREDAEAALAHVVKGVEGAYFRSDLFDRRRILMQQWADYVMGTTTKVVRLRSA